MSLTMRLKTGDNPRRVRIGENISITIVKVGLNRVSICIDAPREVQIHKDGADSEAPEPGY